MLRIIFLLLVFRLNNASPMVIRSQNFSGMPKKFSTVRTGAENICNPKFICIYMIQTHKGSV